MRGPHALDERLDGVRARLLAGLPVEPVGLGDRADRALQVAQAVGAPAVPAIDAAAAARSHDRSRRHLLDAATAQARAVTRGMAAIPILALPALGAVLGQPLWPFYLTPAGTVIGLLGGALIGVGVLISRALEHRAGRCDGVDDEVADLVATALAGGVPPAMALRVVADRMPETAGALRRAASALDLGRCVDGELEGALGRIVRTVQTANTYGTPAAPALRRLADDLRADELARARAAAERLPAHLAFPTALCHLPATLLLVGAPLLATGLEAAAGTAGT